MINKLKPLLFSKIDSGLHASTPQLLKKNLSFLAALLWKTRFAFTKERWTVASLKLENISKVIGSDEVHFHWRDENIIPIYSPTGEVIEERRFPLWVVTLRDVNVFNGTSFVYNKKNKTAYADILDETNSNHHYSLNAVKYTFRNTGILLSNEQQIIIIERAVILSGKGSFNYYHLLIEIFSRLYSLRQVDKFNSIPLLIDEEVLNVRQYKEALDLLNTQNQEIIPVKKGTTYCVRELIIPSDGARMPFDEYNFNFFVPQDVQVNPNAVRFIKNLVLERLKDVTNDRSLNFKRLFVARRTTLRTYNEDDLWQVAEKYGFHKIYPEDYSFTEQVLMFSNCDFLLASSGAALTNILFMNEGANIMYWLSEKHAHFNTFITLAKVMNCSISFIAGKEDKETDVYHSSYYVEPNMFEQALTSRLKDVEAID